MCSPPDHKHACKRSSASINPPVSLATLPVAPKWPEILTWSFLTPVTRQACAPKYLAICLLLLHGPPELDLTNSLYRVGASLRLDDAHPRARPPCQHFCTRMLLPLYHGGTTGVVDPARLCMQGMLDRSSEGYFSQFFTQSFFTASILKSILQPGSWRMDSSYDPSKGDTAFHVYQFLPSPRILIAHPALLPAKRLSCLDLKPLAVFIFTFFRCMDVSTGFSKAKFDSSLLGCRLRHLVSLLESHPVQTLWVTNARTMTFAWFRSLQSLLHLFQRLASVSMWKPDSGFLFAHPHVHVCPDHHEGRLFITMVQDYDAAQLLQWGRDRLRSSEAFYNSSQVPASHFVKVQVHRIPTSAVPSAASDPSNKPKKSTGNKRPAPTSSLDFVSAQPLFELVNPPTNDRGCFSQFMEASPTGSRMPQLPNPESSVTYVSRPPPALRSRSAIWHSAFAIRSLEPAIHAMTILRVLLLSVTSISACRAGPINLNPFGGPSSNGCAFLVSIGALDPLNFSKPRLPPLLGEPCGRQRARRRPFHTCLLKRTILTMIPASSLMPATTQRTSSLPLVRMPVALISKVSPFLMCPLSASLSAAAGRMSMTRNPIKRIRPIQPQPLSTSGFTFTPILISPIASVYPESLLTFLMASSAVLCGSIAHGSLIVVAATVLGEFLRIVLLRPINPLSHMCFIKYGPSCALAIVAPCRG
jgi:hypothetical protein